MSAFQRKPRADLPDDSTGALSGHDIEAVREAFRTEFGGRPPTIGVIGVSGTGKSSTINAMFKTGLEVSHTRACTKRFLATDVTMRALKGPVRDEPVRLVVVDAPGLGEDVRVDPAYIEQYRTHLPDCDVILYVVAARNRAVSLDQQYLKQFPDHHERIVFGINQVDLVHPVDWTDSVNLPSPAMERNLEDIVKDRAQRIGDVIGRVPRLVPYSASRGYNLELLFHAMIAAAPPTRRFVFDLLKNFSHRDFVPAAVRHLVEG